MIAASDEITPGKIDNDRLEDRITAHRLDRELVSWMTGVVGGTAWTHAKHVDPMQGLEAWRQVAQNLLRQGPSQLADEFKFLLNPSLLLFKRARVVSNGINIQGFFGPVSTYAF